MSIKILTINPVTVNGDRESENSKYLSADGEDFYDADGDYADNDDESGDDYIADDVEYNGADGDTDDFYSGFDASGKPTTKSETQQFQDWLDSNYPTWLNGGKLNKGTGYGTFGHSTTKAWNNYGALFAKSIGIGSGTPTPTPNTPTPSKDEQIAQAKKGKIWDKAKGWITSDKAKDVLKSLLAGDGLMGALNTLLGGGSGDATPPPSTDSTQTTPTPTGMSKGLKIGIAVGAVVILGAIIYSVSKSKK